MEPAEFYLLTAFYRNCSCGVGGDDIRYLALSVLGFSLAQEPGLLPLVWMA